MVRKFPLVASRPEAIASPAGNAAQAQPTSKLPARFAPPPGEDEGRIHLDSEPRVAHTAELDPDPRATARRDRRWQSHREADRVREEHSLGGHRPSDPDQRHPRSLEDRVGHGHGRARGHHVQLASRHRRSDVPPHRGEQGARLQRGGRPGSASLVHVRPEALAADIEEPALERLQVHGAGVRVDEHSAGDVGLVTRPSGAVPFRLGGRLCCARGQRADRYALCASGSGRAGRRRHSARCCIATGWRC